MSQAASPRSKELPAGVPEIGGTHLENLELATVIQLYAQTSGRRCVGNEQVYGLVPYLNVSQNLSKAELLYALETLCRWNDARIVLGDDNTFSIERSQR